MAFSSERLSLSASLRCCLSATSAPFFFIFSRTLNLKLWSSQMPNILHLDHQRHRLYVIIRTTRKQMQALLLISRESSTNWLLTTTTNATQLITHTHQKERKKRRRYFLFDFQSDDDCSSESCFLLLLLIYIDSGVRWSKEENKNDTATNTTALRSAQLQ